MQRTQDAWRHTKKTSKSVVNAPRSLVRMLGRFGGANCGSGNDMVHAEEDGINGSLLGQRDEFVHSYS